MIVGNDLDNSIIQYDFGFIEAATLFGGKVQIN